MTETESKYKIGDWIYYNETIVWHSSNEISKGKIHDIRSDDKNPIIYIVKDNSTGIIFKLYPDEVIEKQNKKRFTTKYK